MDWSWHRKSRCISSHCDVFIYLSLVRDGMKMSKRLKNYPDPITVVEKFGADALRYFCELLVMVFLVRYCLDLVGCT